MEGGKVGGVRRRERAGPGKGVTWSPKIGRETLEYVKTWFEFSAALTGLDECGEKRESSIALGGDMNKSIRDEAGSG